MVRRLSAVEEVAAAMSDGALLVEREHHVETWTINLPEQRNPITDEAVVEAFCDVTSRANQDTDVRAVIITGAGPAFSAGGNVKAMARREGLFAGTPYEQQVGYRRGIQRLTAAVFGCEVPLIAAVNGPAIGAGLDLALMCDLRIASQSAFFAESFVKLGIVPGDGGAWLLPRAIGLARAAEMALTGDRVDAVKALSWGLVSCVTSPEELMSEARALAARIVVNAPIAVRLSKRLMRASQHLRLDDVLELSASLQAIAHHTEDHVEAMRAMTERRAGDFHAR